MFQSPIGTNKIGFAEKYENGYKWFQSPIGTNKIHTKFQ